MADPGTRLDLLVVSDLWPPHALGGYEIGAHDLVQRLERRGHRVTVLTSTYGVPGPCRDGNVHRILFEQVRYRHLRGAGLLAETLRSLRALPRARRFLRGASFDLVYLFNPHGLNAALVEELSRIGRPTVAYVSDDWVVRWPRCDPLLARWDELGALGSATRRMGLALARGLLRRAGVLARGAERPPVQHVQFVSRYVRTVSVDRLQPRTEEIIPWGIDVADFPFRERDGRALGQWLFVGRIEEDKGPHTAVEAVALLRSQGHDVSLTVYGDDTTLFAGRLRERVARAGLAAHVRFAGPRPRERLGAEAYGGAGLLVFPAVWDEPFSIALLEAFASGIPVLATATGGTAEIVRDGEVATTFRADDAAHLAARYTALSREPARVAAMARRARELVERQFGIERMVDRVEAHLRSLAPLPAPRR